MRICIQLIFASTLFMVITGELNVIKSKSEINYAYPQKIAVLKIFLLLIFADFAHAEDTRYVNTLQRSSVELSRITLLE